MDRFSAGKMHSDKNHEYLSAKMTSLSEKANFKVRLFCLLFGVLLIAAIIAIVLLSQHKTDPECVEDQDKYCPFSTENTMCLYCGVGEACHENDAYFINGLNDTHLEFIVSEHNRLRSFVARGLQPDQPAAANMTLLKWSESLAIVAQRWADQCTYQHDENRQTPDFKLEPGQNVALHSRSGFTKVTLIEALKT